MSITQTEIGELDVVAFCRATGKWPAGTDGTVIIDKGARKLVEIANEHGEGIDFVWIPARQLRLVWKCPHRAP